MIATLNGTNGRHTTPASSEPLDAVTNGMRALETGYYGQCGRTVEIAREGRSRITAAAIDAARKAREEALEAARKVRDVWQGLGSFFTSLAHQLDEATLNNLTVEIEPPASPVATRAADEAVDDRPCPLESATVDADSPEAINAVRHTVPPLTEEEKAEELRQREDLVAERTVTMHRYEQTVEVPADSDKERAHRAVEQAIADAGATCVAINVRPAEPATDEPPLPVAKETAHVILGDPPGPRLTAVPNERPKNRGSAKRKRN